jgi:predicted small lipoprotein YifL
MKKLYWLIAALAILSMILTACGGQAPTPAEPVAEEPTAAQPAAEEPTAEEPAETEGPAPAAQEGGWCSDTNIVFFPGGSPGGGFETVVYNGQSGRRYWRNVECV